MSASGTAFRLTHDLVAQFLACNGYTSSLDEFYREGGDFVTVTKDCAGNCTGTDKPLVEIVTEYCLTEKTSRNIQSKAKRLVFDEVAPFKVEEIKCHQTIDTLHSGNILCLKTFSVPDLVDDRVIISSSTDKTVKVSLMNSGQFFMEVNHSHRGGAILSLDVHPSKPYILTSSMDFTVALTNLSLNETIEFWGHHTKFVPHAKFSPDGSTFITGSYDHTLCLYKAKQDASGYVLDFSFDFNGNVEAVCYTPDSNWVIVGVRDDNYLHYIDVSSKQVNKFNMNSNGDDIVSFTIMDLAISPNGQYLLGATDHRSGRVILFNLFSNLILRDFYGVPQDEFSTPRIVWHSSGRYFFVTGDDFSIHCFDLSSSKRVGNIPAHSGIVRSLHIDTSSNTLLSGSFDRTIKVWSL